MDSFRVFVLHLAVHNRHGISSVDPLTPQQFAMPTGLLAATVEQPQ
jgi:hypothetical protein